MENNGAHIHRFKNTIVPATCQDLGYTLHECECGYTFKDSFKPASAHSYFITEKLHPTCTAGGRQSLRCSVCMEKQEEELPALGHDWDEWIDQELPTCTTEGLQVRICRRCREKEERSAPAKGHKLQYLRPSETEKDKDEYFCENCGETFLEPSKAVKKKKKRKNKLLKVFAAVAVLLIAAVLAPLAEFFFIPNFQYHTGKLLIEHEQYAAAFYLLYQCKSYKDTQDILGDFRVYPGYVQVTGYDYYGNPTEYRITERNTSGGLTYHATLDKDSKITSEQRRIYDDHGNEIGYYAGDTLVLTYEYTYDFRGNVTEAIYKPTSGNETRTVYEYDWRGNLLSRTEYNHNKVVTDKFVYEYDWLGNRVRYIVYDGKNIDYSRLYEYDLSGQLTVVKEYNSVNQYNGKTEYTYSLNGRITSVIEYDSQDQVTSEKHYEYDIFNRNTLYSYERYGSYNYSTKYEYKYDIFGNPSGSTYYSGDELSSITSYKYDILGHLKGYNTTYADGDVYRTEFNSDIFGNIKKETHYDEDGRATGSSEYKYNWLGFLKEETRYDSSGNITRKYEFRDPVFLYYG